MRNSHPSVGVGHAAVTIDTDDGILLRMQASHRDYHGVLLHLIISHASLRCNDEQLSVTGHFSWNVVSAHFINKAIVCIFQAIIFGKTYLDLSSDI